MELQVFLPGSSVTDSCDSDEEPVRKVRAKPPAAYGLQGSSCPVKGVLGGLSAAIGPRDFCLWAGAQLETVKLENGSAGERATGRPQIRRGHIAGRHRRLDVHVGGQPGSAAAHAHEADPSGCCQHAGQGRGRYGAAHKSAPRHRPGAAAGR